MKNMNTMTLLAAGTCAMIAASAANAAFSLQTGDIVVSRVSSGSASTSLSTSTAAMYLDVYRKTAGTWALDSSLAMPSTGASTKLTLSGTASSEGFISRGSDNRSVAVFGYNYAAASSTGTAKTLALVDSSGTVTSRTATISGAARSIIETGTGYYASTDSRVSWNANATPSTVTDIKTGNARVLASTGSQLWVTSGSSAFFSTAVTGAGTLGTGLPTAGGQTATFAMAGSGNSPYGLCVFDTNSDGTTDLAYVADSNSATGGITKYVLSAGSWVSKGTIGASIYGLSGYYDGSSVVLSATSFTTALATGGTSKLYTFTDSSISGALSGTLETVATLTSQTGTVGNSQTYAEAFRGTAYIPAPGAIALLGVAGLVGARRRR
jgi:hypothetical protein